MILRLQLGVKIPTVPSRGSFRSSARPKTGCNLPIMFVSVTGFVPSSSRTDQQRCSRAVSDRDVEGARRVETAINASGGNAAAWDADGSYMQKVLPCHPAGRIGRPEGVGHAIAFLASCIMLRRTPARS